MSLNECDWLHKENLKVVVRLYEALVHKNLPGILACFDEEAVWTMLGPPEIPFAGRHEGLAGVDRMLHARIACAECLEFRAVEYQASTNHVVVTGHEVERARTTGEIWRTDWLHFHSVRHGRIYEVKEFCDTAAVLRAFQRP